MNEVRIGLFGLQGHQITRYIPNLQRARVTGIGGMDEAQVQNVKASFPDVPVYVDLDSMLAEADVDLISFCTVPRTEQTRQALQAIKAGKHVLVEKPMATTMDDLGELRQAVEASGTELRTMTPMPYEADLTGMKRIVESGALGTIVQVYAMKSYPYHDRRPQDRRMDGGLICQAGIHAVSYVRYVTGLELVEVSAQDTGTGNPQEGELQLGATAAFRMSNGGLAAILCNYCNQKSVGYHGNDQLRVHGMNGMIELVDGKTRRMLVLKDQEPTSFEDVEPEQSYPQDLIDCILDGTPTMLSQEDSFRNTEIVIRSQDSATQGTPLRI